MLRLRTSYRVRVQTRVRVRPRARIDIKIRVKSGAYTGLAVYNGDDISAFS